MKKTTLLLFLSFYTVGFSQKKINKKITTSFNNIEISTIGLDDFVLENSESEFIEITLIAENSNKQHIISLEHKNTLKIEFLTEQIAIEEPVFRKFITTRLQRAHAIIKVPKKKRVIILGDNISLESKSYGGDLEIYVEKGTLNLHQIQANAVIKLYAGSVKADVKNTNINIVSNIGKIEVNGIQYEKNYIKKENYFTNNFSFNSIRANVFINSIITK